MVDDRLDVDASVDSKARNMADDDRDDKDDKGVMASHSMMGMSASDQSAMKEIRRRREAERKKHQSYFRDMREAMNAKRQEAAIAKARQAVEKEMKRKRRHSLIKKEVAEYKQVEVERRRSTEKQWTGYVAEQTRKRQEEIKEKLHQRVKELDEKFKQDHEKYLKKEEQKKKKSEVKTLGQSTLKEKLNEKYLEDWDGTKKDRETQSAVVNLCLSAPMEEIFKMYELPLQLTYNYYAHLDIDPYLRETSGRGGGGALPYRNFCMMMNHFGILGTITDDITIKLVYRSVTKGKLINKRLPVGLDFEQFKEALFRIMLKYKDYFMKEADEGAKNDVKKDKAGPKYLKTKMQVVDIMGPEFHLYNNIKDEKDDYPNLKSTGYSYLDAFFTYLSLPQASDELYALLDTLRREYHSARPDKDKLRPKKAEYQKLHKLNEVIRKKRADLYGPSQTAAPRERTKSAKLALTSEQREKGLRNKSLIKSSKKDRYDQEF